MLFYLFVEAFYKLKVNILEKWDSASLARFANCNYLLKTFKIACVCIYLIIYSVYNPVSLNYYKKKSCLILFLLVYDHVFIVLIYFKLVLLCVGTNKFLILYIPEQMGNTHYTNDTIARQVFYVRSCTGLGLAKIWSYDEAYSPIQVSSMLLHGRDCLYLNVWFY